jgi:glycosyltransferase involved in cell wall biosynthesis
MKKIIFVHLLNDFSGSPKVLSQVIGAAKRSGKEVVLYTGKSGDGFLEGVTPNHHHYFYKHFKNKLLTLFSFAFSQISLFFKLLKYKNEDVIFYVNTMLPFGAAMAGRLIGKPVYYHVHETSITPLLLKRFLRIVIRLTAERVVFVSESLRESESFKLIDECVIYNAMSDEFVGKAMSNKYQWKQSDGMYNVMLICSLKVYKGVNEFLEICKLCESAEHIRFTLILNAESEEISAYFGNVEVPQNVSILSKQRDLHVHYRHASLLLNLSRIDQWVETFGLTILEAMSYGVPCIVPTVGGPVEIVDDAVNGYHFCSYEVEKIADKIHQLANNEELSISLSKAAREKAKTFSIVEFEANLACLIP